MDLIYLAYDSSVTLSHLRYLKVGNTLLY